MGFRINSVSREEDKVYLKDTPTNLLDYANDRVLVDAFNSHGIVSKAYLMRKYQITWLEAYNLSMHLLELFKGTDNVEVEVRVENTSKQPKRRFA